MAALAGLDAGLEGGLTAAEYSDAALVDAAFAVGKTSDESYALDAGVAVAGGVDGVAVAAGGLKAPPYNEDALDEAGARPDTGA